MENHPYTDLTLQMYRDLRQKYPNIGTVVQSYLKRTVEDVTKLCEEGPTNLRVCKGIYNESANIAYKKRQEINNSFIEILTILFQNNSYVGIATHDDQVINNALQLIDKYNISKNSYEFQMLLGVREELRQKLLDDGHKLRVYIPYGRDWYAYSIRRLKENPAIASNIIKGFFIK
jgi:proline dehydrogenase